MSVPTERLSAGVEAMQIVGLRCQSDTLAPGNEESTRTAGDKQLIGLDLHEDVIVGSEILGLDDFTLPKRTGIGDVNVFRSPLPP